MNKFLEIASLTENTSYPSGYNVLEILGTGDERPASFDEPTGPGVRPYSGRQLRLDALDSELPWQGSTIVIVTATEEDGTGGTGTVEVAVMYGAGSCTPTTIALGTQGFIGVDADLTGLDTVSLPYPALSVTNLTFLGTPYTVKEIVDGTTVVIDGSFGVTTGTAVVDYTAKGYAEFTFSAPSSDVNDTSYIVGRWSDAAPETIVINTTQLGEGGTSDTGDLSIDPAETSLAYGASTILTITGGDDVPSDCNFTLLTSAGTVDASGQLGDIGFPNAVGSITGRNTFTVDYPVKSVNHVQNIQFLQVSYYATAVDGNIVTVAPDFPYPIGEVTCSYTATRIAEVTFVAPQETTECFIVASSPDAGSAACIIEVTAEGEPGGYNWVNRPVFPTLKISGPLTMASNGTDVAVITVEIYDPNAENPFLIQKGAFESCSVSGPQDFTTEYWITEILGAWEDETKTLPIPLSYLVFRNNEVHINDGWAAADAPEGWMGLYRPEVYIEYNGYMTLAVEDGLQTAERWWIRAGDDERRTETDVSGTIYVDEDATMINDSSEVPIPSAAGNRTTIKFYYRPDAGEEGIAYLNAAYNDTSVTWPISVTCGSFVGADINMTAEPSTIAPGEKSLLTFTATDSNGGPLYGDADNPVTVNFFIQKGKGSINPASADLVLKTGETEEVESDSTTTFSVSNPPVRITALSVIGNGTFVWNGQITISGSNLTLVDQTFPLSTCPLSVTYDWGGAAKVFYYAIGDSDKDVVYVGGRIDATANTLCKIDIDSERSGTGDDDVNLSINAADSSIAKGASTAVTATAYKNGVPITKDVKFSLVPEKGSITMSYNTNTITNEDCSISDRKTTSTEYLPTSVTTVRFLGDIYPVEKVEGTTITLSGDGFPVASGTCQVTYVPSGLWKGTFNAANSDYTAHLNIVAENVLETDVVKVGDGDPGPDPNDPPVEPTPDPTGPDLTVSAEPRSIKRGEESLVKAEVKINGEPKSGQKILFVVISGPGSMSSPDSLSSSAGLAESNLVTSEIGPYGTSQINVTWGGITKSVEVTVEPQDIPVPEVEDLPEILISGTLDPATKEVIVSNSVVVRSLGAARDADEFGCIDQDPASMGVDAMLHLYYTNNTDLGWVITDVVVTGAACEPGLDTAGKYAYNTLDLYLPLIYGPNVAREQIVHVVDKLDESAPIVGATVTLGGSSSITDQSGTAKFTGVAPGTYQIGITHPNYKDNRAGVAGGTGVYDTDQTNDNFVVKPYSTRRWILDKIAFNIKIQYKGYQPTSRSSA